MIINLLDMALFLVELLILSQANFAYLLTFRSVSKHIAFSLRTSFHAIQVQQIKNLREEYKETPPASELFRAGATSTQDGDTTNDKRFHYRPEKYSQTIHDINRTIDINK
jgi:hypothetical protein